MQMEAPHEANVMITAYVPKSLHRDVKVTLARRGETFTDIVREALRMYLKKYADNQLVIAFK